jgi:lia operon protein LiaG
MKKLAALALIMLGVGVLCAFFVFNKNDLMKFKGDPYLQEKTVDASAIKSIHAETDTFNVTFVPGTTDDIRLRLEGNASKQHIDKIILKADTKGDTLYIEGNTKNNFSFGISIINLKLTVELPEKLWNTVEIKTDTGNISVDQLKAGQFNVKLDTGNLKVSNYSFKDIVFETDTGNVTFTNGVGSIKGETDTGNIRIENEELRNDIALQSDTGNVTINVDKHPQSAAIHIQKDVGSSKVEWDGFSDNNDSKSVVDGKIGSGDIQIDIQSEVGSVKLGSR